MSRRILVPILLLLAAACAFAAVFVVQELESRGGPLSEPYADLAFSPGGDGVADTAQLRFNPRGTQTVTVRVVDADGDVVATMDEDRVVSDDYFEPWDGTRDDGTPAPNGAYRFWITRPGDRRTYAPSRPTILDRTPPNARLDKVAYDDGLLTGLLIAPAGTRLVATTAEIDDPDAARPPAVLSGLRAWRPEPGTVSGTPTTPPAANQDVVRFAVPVTPAQLEDLTLYARDGADNRVAFAFIVGSSVELDR
ncbi:MAG: hypothetical protein JWM25_509 [Thermoleophilia bacterium]|nr:hypothetical protein [Thermoleophilia bacterium]MCZ4495926.1 hypothetical protein [Thermoleophilia bacterium]